MVSKVSMATSRQCEGMALSLSLIIKCAYDLRATHASLQPPAYSYEPQASSTMHWASSLQHPVPTTSKQPTTTSASFQPSASKAQLGLDGLSNGSTFPCCASPFATTTLHRPGAKQVRHNHPLHPTDTARSGRTNK